MGSIGFINKIGSGSIKPNIFMQEEEPTIKEGIWFKAKKQVDKISVVDNLVTEGVWASGKADAPSMFNVANGIQIGNVIYIFGAGGSSNEIYKYDMETDAYELLLTMENGRSSPALTTDGKVIYVCGKGNDDEFKVAKYDIEAKTIEDLPVSTQKTGDNAHLIGDEIFTIYDSGTSLNIISKYNVKTGETTVLVKKSDTTLDLKYTRSVLFGTDIYLFGGNLGVKTVKYSTVDNTLTELANAPFELGRGAGVVLNNDDVYLISVAGNKGFCKYNITTNTYTTLPNIIATSANGIVGFFNNTIYILGNDSTYNKTYTYTMPTFPDHSIIVIQGVGEKKTQLYSNKDIEGRLLYGFNDAVYSDVNNTLDNDISLYYGTGTEWIKFKN